MTTHAVREPQSPLEGALLDVDATLAELLHAAAEQYAALVAGDRDQLEGVTRRQETLSSRLARAERKRHEILAGESLIAAIAALPADQAERLGRMTRSI